MTALESDYTTPNIVRLSYDVNKNIEYIGKAAASSNVTAAVWQIIKLEYDIDLNIDQILYAEGTNLFNKKWSIRATYSYS